MGTNEPMVEFAGVTLITAARDTLKLFVEHPKIGPILAEKGKKGGYICFAQVGYGIFSASMVGSHPANKPETFDVVTRKARYLLEHPHSLMSRDGRDPSKELWGGGMRIPSARAIIAFSGFPEHLDELFVMVLAVRLKIMEPSVVKMLLTQYPNDFVKPGEGDVLFV
jgi:hypothetical protein